MSTLNAKPTVEELKVLFDSINQDCKITGESVVNFSDTEYYAEQIENIYELSPEESLELAVKLSII